MPQIRAHMDLGKVAEIRNGVWHLLNAAPSGPVAGQFYYDTGLNRFRGFHGADGWQTLLPANTRLDQIAAPTASVSLNNQKLVSVAAGTADTDGVNVGQLNAVVQGFDWKDSVRAATTANITLSGAQTIDGVAVTAGQRVLVKNQTTGSQNGIYVVAAGAWSRASDADAAGELTPNTTVAVEEGTTNADSWWQITTNGTIVVGTTATTWAQVGSGTTYTGGNGIAITGSSIAADLAASSGLVFTGGKIDLDPTNGVPVNRGGTGSTTAAGARTNLGATGKSTGLIGNGSATSIVYTHNLGSQHVIVQCFDATTNELVETDVTLTSTTQVTIGFAAAPSTNGIRVVVIG